MIPVWQEDDDLSVAASWATEPLFFRAEAPGDVPPKRYQSAGVEYLLSRDHGILGDAPGVGKTAQAIFLSSTIKARRTLVVCPASLRLNWEREVWKWSTRENVKTYPVMKSSDGVSSQADYVIMSYDLLSNPDIFAAVMDLRWDHFVADEAHAIKDPKGNRRTHHICAPDGIKRVAGRITLATGTLLPNQPIECYNAVRLTNHEAIDGASLEDFRKFYYDYGQGFVTRTKFVGGKKVTVTEWSNSVRNVPKNLSDLNHRLRKHVMVRRLKEQVLHELPPKQWHPFPLSMTGEIKRAITSSNWRAAERLYEMDPEAFTGKMQIDGAVSTARLELGLAKTPGVLEYVRDLLDGGVHKLILGVWHTQVLELMRAGLEEYGVVWMDGRSSDAAKQRAVDQFQSDDKFRVIVGQMIPLGEGWTLTAAKDVVLAEPFWVPGKNDQLLDRAHRLGQRDNVIGHIPVVPGTLDEKIMMQAIVKDKAIYQVLDARG